MPDSYDMWLQFSNTTPSSEYLDYGFSDPTPYGGNQGFSFMGAADEGEFYSPSETGGYAVDLEDWRTDDESHYYDPVEHQANVVGVEDMGPLGDFLDPAVTDQMSEIPSLSELERIANVIAKFSTVAGSAAPIFGGERDKRDLRRAAAAQPGNVPAGIGLSGARVRETRAEMINRENIAQLFGRTGRTGIDADYRLMNVPQPRPVSIPSGTIGTTSGKRRIYGK